MRIADYPPQEPLSEVGEVYAGEVMRRARDVEGTEFSYGDDAYQGITLHAPEAPNGGVLAFVHGGGWTSGYKEHMDFMAPAFTAAGVVFASIGYRLAPAHLFPTGVEDVASGIARLHRHVAEFGGDPDRVFIGGHSAGGPYTALLAVRRSTCPRGWSAAACRSPASTASAPAAGCRRGRASWDPRRTTVPPARSSGSTRRRRS